MKITKNQLKIWIREVFEEEGEESKPEEEKPQEEPAEQPSQVDSLELEDNPFDKEEVEEAKKRDYKAEYKKYGSSKKAKKYRAELNKYNRQKGTYGNGDKMDASHKGGKIVGFEEQSKNRGRAEKSRLKKEGIVKSTSKRVYVKEIKQWMKTLEENRYKKVPHADCRRVAWFVNNNMTEDYESMPDSMRKKWSKAAYGRERFLAKEFIKHKKNEQKLRESIRRIIKKKVLNEWSSKRDPKKADLKWIRHIQISTADPDVIRHDHIKKTHKAMKKVDKKLAQQFEKLGDKYIKIKEDYTKEYYKYYSDDKPQNHPDIKKASKIFEKGQKQYAQMGKKLIDFTEKNFNAVK